MTEHFSEETIPVVAAGFDPDDLPPELSDELIDELLAGARTPEELTGPDGLLQRLTKRLVERAMEAELTDHLGYPRGQAPPGGTGNARNGFSEKTVHTEHGSVRIEQPRDRAGSFEPQIVPRHQRRFHGFDEKIIAMYARGMSVRDIQAHLRELYGVEVGHDLISRVTDAVLDDVREWQARPLEDVYPILFLDALIVKVRDGGAVRNLACYVAIGVNLDGERDVLGLWFQRSEGAKFWLAVLTELKQRGVRDVLICCVDGLKGFPEAIEAVFPQAWVQTCIVHLIRQSLRFVPDKHRRIVAKELKPIYTAVDADAAAEALTAFEAEWSERYPMIGKTWREAWEHVIPFLAFPPQVRRVVYTTDENVKRSGGACGPALGRWIGRAWYSQGLRSAPVASVQRARARIAGFQARAALAGEPSALVSARSVGVTLRCGRGRPRSEAQELGLSPAAQLARQRASRVAPHWRRPRPLRSLGPSLASRRRAAGRRARPARSALALEPAPL
ncbi:MAG: IS256 family transposase [Chloroflexi bacterium]|nr:MAG: IS256 family transposase [Chloroflexota bacterium]